MLLTKKCIIEGCPSTRKATKHCFPKRTCSADQWREAINSSLLNDVKTADLYKYSVCSKHFKESDYSTTFQRRRLNPNAVPSVGLQNCAVVTAETMDVDDVMLPPSATEELTVGVPFGDAAVSCDKMNTYLKSKQPDGRGKTAKVDRVIVVNFFFSDQRLIADLNISSTPTSSGVAAMSNDILKSAEMVEGSSHTQKMPMLKVNSLSQKSAPDKQDHFPLVTQRELARLRALRKSQPILRQKLRRYKKRLDDMEKLRRPLFDNWEKLNDTQKIFLAMQLRLAGKNKKVKPSH